MAPAVAQFSCLHNRPPNVDIGTYVSNQYNEPDVRPAEHDTDTESASNIGLDPDATEGQWKRANQEHRAQQSDCMHG
eukprot:11752655-Karenia_brevis.AAC.1